MQKVYFQFRFNKIYSNTCAYHNSLWCSYHGGYFLKFRLARSEVPPTSDLAKTSQGKYTHAPHISPSPSHTYPSHTHIHTPASNSPSKTRALVRKRRNLYSLVISLFLVVPFIYFCTFSIYLFIISSYYFFPYYNMSACHNVLECSYNGAFFLKFRSARSEVPPTSDLAKTSQGKYTHAPHISPSPSHTYPSHTHIHTPASNSPSKTRALVRKRRNLYSLVISLFLVFPFIYFCTFSIYLFIISSYYLFSSLQYECMP